MTNHKNSPSRKFNKPKGKRAALTPDPLLSSGPAPNAADVLSALDTIVKAAAHLERSERHADDAESDWISESDRMGLLRATLVLLFYDASSSLVWDALEYILVPSLIGLSEGKRQTNNIIGTGMVGSDGREHLHDLTENEGEPLSRIIDAIAHHCPQILFFNQPDSFDD